MKIEDLDFHLNNQQKELGSNAKKHCSLSINKQ